MLDRIQFAILSKLLENHTSSEHKMFALFHWFWNGIAYYYKVWWHLTKLSPGIVQHMRYDLRFHSVKSFKEIEHVSNYSRALRVIPVRVRDTIAMMYDSRVQTQWTNSDITSYSRTVITINSRLRAETLVVTYGSAQFCPAWRPRHYHQFMGDLAVDPQDRGRQAERNSAER